MPPTRVAQSSGRNTAATKRAASVPVLNRQENSRLESLRFKRKRLPSVDVEDVPPSNAPSGLISRGRAGKRETPSQCAISQTDCTANTSTTVPITDVSELRPQKRQKRSASTPATPRPPTHRRSRSRAGSPSTDVEYVPPSRVSTRLARKIHSFINNRNTDIYTHLAGSDGAGNLLNEPRAGTAIVSAPYPNVCSQSLPTPRGRRRKVVDLTDENAKRDLIEVWARMRQSQGTLSVSGMDEHACSSQIRSCDARKGDGSVSQSAHLEAITRIRRHTPDPEFIESQGTIPDDSHTGSLSIRVDSENAMPVGTDGKESGPMLPSGGGTVTIEIPSTPLPDLRVGQGSSNDGVSGTNDLLRYPGSSSAPPTHPSPLLREDSTIPMHEQAEAVNLDSPSNNSHSVTRSQTCSFDNNSIHLDADQEFHMLDVPDIFTLPWEPVGSHHGFYVPPSLGKLISGMKEQLTIEARARQRAEELYQTELSRRVSAEKIVQDLGAELKERQTDSSRRRR